MPAESECNNDKAISPNGKKVAFSATVPPQKGSQIFLADADGSHVMLMTSQVAELFSRLVAG